MSKAKHKKPIKQDSYQSGVRVSKTLQGLKGRKIKKKGKK